MKQEYVMSINLSINFLNQFDFSLMIISHNWRSLNNIKFEATFSIIIYHANTEHLSSK
jgi:hypothetical protein